MSNQVNTTKTCGLQEIPEHLRGGSGLGNENVGASDLVLPRLQIIQSLSPELKASSPKYIAGAKQGDIFNTLNRTTYPDGIRFCDVYYRKEYAVFVSRQEGGGYRGSFPRQEDALAYIESSPERQRLEVTEMAIHFILILDEEGNVISEAVLPMKSTQLKVSRNLNGMIRERCRGNMDRFSGTWKLTTQNEVNKKGEFYNYVITAGPWATAETFEQAKKTYRDITGGLKDMDRSEMTEREEEEAF